MYAWETLTGPLRTIQDCLREVEATWLVGGSCGLLLQDVALTAAPRDLDLYVDAEGALELHQALSDYATDSQVEDRSSIYRSILSHYRIEGAKVELVGGFEVTSKDSLYKVEVDFLHKHYSPKIHLTGEAPTREILETLHVMPLEHELIFNVLRNRPDRYEAIAAVMKSRQPAWSHAMEALVERNACSESLIHELQRLLLT
ncbi:nucleotidyltransferase domain-containing protein [Paenibacillus sp. FSL H8-0034]|uniref:nucleotidyltransferase domain-containing protein n=1 Tax=Paenibacillus sp. FSL H8-0034 TaxID=2954671 RepID=UPI0030F5A96F